MRRTIPYLLILFVTLASCTQDEPEILIIGDSISIGYTPFVREFLAEKATVYHNEGNAQHTGYGLKNIEGWIGDKEWDIVQFNWGLWDLCYRHPDSEVQGNRDKINGSITNGIDVYASNLDSIVRLIREKSDAKLIFVTTTYIPEEEAGRFTEDAIRYNEAAKEIMLKHHVTINDIYENSVNIHKRLGKGADDVHYLPEGSRELGKLISDFLLEEM